VSLFTNQKEVNRAIKAAVDQYNEWEETMRYEYTVTKEGGEAEIMKEMSWKKLFKKLLLKYPKFSGWCTYINKKGHVQTRSFNQGREVKNL
jgi:hypothetical protein|tara:strand:- start:148 stop:420 length:273 start_codon:yes stop_codon:yes gene_type:complete